MKTKHYRFFALIIIALIFSVQANAENLRRIVSLSGYWKFSIGDDISWASPSYNDSGWDQITVPGKWEDEGYKDYNGYAWYRRTFKPEDIPANTTLYLVLGRIDDVDEVYLNGKLIGKSGKFPPNYETAYTRTRKYIIPFESIKEDAENVIAVRVYDGYLEGGIVNGHAGIYVDEDFELLNLDLSGKWKFHTGNNKDWKLPEFNDEDWKLINVPDQWENEGYEDLDGYAWYRVKFKLPGNLDDGDLYLALGKIDDVDDVYLNGEFVGDVYDMRRGFDYNWNGGEYNVRRIYKIKDGLLKRSGMNTLAVRVHDDQGEGGIYEGPIGIMSAENYREYMDEYHSNETFWEYLYNKFTR
jgi:beta-galactosidase/beta-glucuronidase